MRRQRPCAPLQPAAAHDVMKQQFSRRVSLFFLADLVFAERSHRAERKAPLGAHPLHHDFLNASKTCARMLANIM